MRQGPLERCPGADSLGPRCHAKILLHLIQGECLDSLLSLTPCTPTNQGHSIKGVEVEVQEALPKPDEDSQCPTCAGLRPTGSEEFEGLLFCRAGCHAVHGMPARVRELKPEAFPKSQEPAQVV